MLKKLLKKQNFTEKDFLKELLNPVFNKKLLEEKYNIIEDINTKNVLGESYLHLCSKKGCLESVKWLIEKGAKLEINNKEMETPLFYAALSNNDSITNFLISKGANTEHRNKHKRTALQEVVIVGKNTVDTLFKHTKNLNNSDIYGNNLVFDAIANGNMDLINKVIKNKNIDINKVNNKGHTILHKESVLKNTDLAIRLMEEGANPTILDKHGKNFLFYAVIEGIKNESVINKSIELGCDINSKDHENRTILMQAIENYYKVDKENKETKTSQFKMIEKLIQKGVDVTATDIDRENVLFYALKGLDTKLIELLLDNPLIDINTKNSKGETVLTICVLHGIKASFFIKKLLKRGANPNIADNTGSTIIEKLIESILFFYNHKKIDKDLEERLVLSADYIDVLKLIIENSKVDLSKLTSKGKPLFFDVITFFNYELFKILRNYKININQKDKDGHNIIFYLMDFCEHSPKYDKKLYLETLQNLINIGVELDSIDINGNTILHKAINEKCEYTLKLFLESKADNKALDKNGRTLMHNAIWKNDIRYFRLIHSYNKDIINIPDKFGVLPINYAAFMGKVDLVKVMLEEEAHVNNTNNISPKMIEFFKKFHHNIKNLERHADNKIDEQNLKLLANSMKKEFNII